MNAQQLVSHMITMEMTLDASYARVVRDARMELEVALGGKDKTRTVSIDPYVPPGRTWRGASTAEVVERSKEQFISEKFAEAKRVADMYADYA